MPTSGSHFTTQAPLLPVFFLGLLATDPKHKSVSKDWFEKVVETPVRSVSAKKKRNPPILVIYGKMQAGSGSPRFSRKFL
jgi:hypothetical protein